jgi:YidC/Oxa1 family membrane protein insertase
MDSQKRLLVALGLSFLVTMVWMTFFAPKPPPGGADAGVATTTTPVDAGVAAAVMAPVEAQADGGAVAELPPVIKIERDRELIDYAFTSEGAGLVEGRLKTPKMREQQQVTIAEGLQRLLGKKTPPPPQMDMAIPVPGQPVPLAVAIVGSQPFPANVRYRVEEGERALHFTATQGPWEVKKSFEWSDQRPAGAPEPRKGDPEAWKFELAYTVTVKNVGSAPASGDLSLHYARNIDPTREHKGNFFGGIGNESRASCFVGEKLESQAPHDDAKPVEHAGPVSFFGIDQQYFLAAIFPLDGPKQGRCVLNAQPTTRSVDALFPLTLAPGETVSHRFGVFTGPKDSEMLATVPTFKAEGAAATSFVPKLDQTVEFGMWAVICKVLLAVMKFFFNLTGNWGVAIILLTLVVKVLLLPLTHKSMVSAEAMKKLQPKIEEIRKKFADDKERQNLETMKVYQEAKVNPFGGCLPMLLQMPIWIALFTTLRTSYELYGEPFIAPLWTDLTYKDPTYLLPILLGITMIATQKLQPQMMDAAQAKMMTYVMPIFFTAIMLNYPAGLSLYIFTNNLLTIGQQYGLRKYLEKTGVATPPTPPVARAAKRKA